MITKKSYQTYHVDVVITCVKIWLQDKAANS